MYEYKSAVGKSKEHNGVWEEFNINDFDLNKVLFSFSKVYVTVYNPFSKKNEVLYLNDILDKINNYSDNFDNYLKSIGNSSLPTVPGDIKLNLKKVKRKDLVKADWKMKPITHGGNPSSNDINYDLDWLYLKKENVDPLEFYKYAMVSVNGFYHFLDASEQGIWIADGMKTVKRTNDNHLSVVSFKEVGKLKYIKINEDMIYKQMDEGKLYDQCYINIGEDTTDKTIILVIGGYMHIKDNLTFKRINETTIKLDLKNTPYLKRFHESQKFLNLDYLNLEKGYTEDHVSLEDITSDEVIKRYLTGWQSFIILLDSEDVYVKKHKINNLPVPGKYISDIEPIYPMIFGHGMAGEYWDIYDCGEWCINLSYGEYNNRRYTTVNINETKAIDNQDITNNRTEFSYGYLLEIGKVEPEII